MSQPPPYSKTTNFAQDEANNVGGRSTVRTDRVDAEFSNVETTLDATLANLSLIQRDDGRVRDGMVELFSLSATARAALQGELTPRGDWSSPTAYVVNDVVQFDAVPYFCVEAHTSGTFATDLAAGKWLLTAAGSAAAADGSAATAAAQATIATTQAGLAATARGGAEAAQAGAETAKTGSETARDAALAATRIYANTAAGLAAVASGEYFYVPSAEDDESLILYKDNAGVAVEIKRYPSSLLLDVDTRAGVPFALDDDDGYMAEPPVSTLGYSHSFTLAECDSIVIYGDSYTDATYVLQDKAWVSVVSNLGPWRWRNMGRSGFTSTHQNNMIVDGRKEVVPGTYDYGVYRGSPHSARFARYALLMSWTNDLSAGTATDWLKAAQHITDVWRANGCTPVVVAENRDFSDTTNFQAVTMTNFARQNGVDFIDCQHMNRELQVKNGPFTDGSHPGTRTGPALYGSPILRWMEKLPRPQRSIKVYDVRETVTVSSLADLMFRDEYQLAQRFKEISLSHIYISDQPETFEERSQWNYNGVPGGTPNQSDILDQYLMLQGGSDLDLEDYALIRIALPAHARDLTGAALEVGTDATATYVLDRFANNTVGTFTPVGAWTAATLDNGVIQLDQATLARCMRDNELFVLLYKSGGVRVARPAVHYSPVAGAQVEPKLIRDYKVAGAELLTTQGCASLTGWTQTGTPVVVTPFDLVYGGPRAPGLTTTITGAIEVTSTNKISQSAAVTASRENLTHWRVRAWARYWPKVFLKNALSGYGFPAGEIIERTTHTFPADSLITSETFDWRLLKLEVNFSAAPSSSFTAYEFQEKPVGLYWMPIDFYVSTLSGVLPGYINLRLSSTDGTLQIGKVSVQEVAEYEHRH